MAICRLLPLCTQPEAHQTVVTTLLCDVASSRAPRLKTVWLCSLAECGEADRGQREQDVRHQEHRGKTRLRLYFQLTEWNSN